MVERTFRISQISNVIQAIEATATRLVLVDGLGGAGKSILAGALATELGAPVVQGDDFFRPSAERQHSGGVPDSVGERLDWRRLERQVLDPLSQGEHARYQRYDWADDRLADWVTVPGRGTVLVEGVYLLRNELRRYASVSIWVQTPREVRLARGIERDGEAARSRWVDEWMPAEDAYMSDMRPDAAAMLVVDGQRAPASIPDAASLFSTPQTALRGAAQRLLRRSLLAGLSPAVHTPRCRRLV